jgi:aryl-alcohol dehydrogenase-like predicted oxidoreductase
MFDESRQIVHHQSRAYARKACEGALQRLGTDYIDLFTLRGPVQVGMTGVRVEGRGFCRA